MSRVRDPSPAPFNYFHLPQFQFHRRVVSTIGGDTRAELRRHAGFLLTPLAVVQDPSGWRERLGIVSPIGAPTARPEYLRDVMITVASDDGSDDRELTSRKTIGKRPWLRGFMHRSRKSWYFVATGTKPVHRSNDVFEEPCLNLSGGCRCLIKLFND